ncbi:TetR/AcrR family transcriptional regulator [Patulibacter sp.]|uniref:TetR/AcrR family transcriptional regulator n=1 Tax=Patulibacter sp. TaxID=1912859 RepID=UPI00271DCADB|nr:TetR/AcrR family transcriptional regulator [Patulibacter sp.]MDO9409267.1 TetR/AcrR family transcriptional regulator [Patulibacter sp.]
MPQSPGPRLKMTKPSISTSLPKSAKTARKAVVKAGAKAGKAAGRATRPSGRGQPRPRAAHLGPERRRPMILDAAFGVFLEKGYEGASMEEIARRAGVSKPVVYSSFAGKDALFGELLRREEERILQAISAAVPTELDEDDLEPAITEALCAFLEAVVASPESFKVVFLGAGGSDANITRRVQRGRQRQIDQISTLAEGWIARQGIPDAERQGRLHGFLLVGMAENAARALIQEPGRFPPRMLAEQISRMILSAYDPSSARGSA